ncbi:MAG: HAD family hydrolase [Acetobacteraceae bacterium]
MHEVVFLFDVDNTLIDNDGVQEDLRQHIEHEHGAAARARYWALFEELRAELGYADYVGALERFRAENLHDPSVLRLGNWMIDYAFARRVYRGATEAVRHAAGFGPTVVLSDGDALFQPRKVEQSGLWALFEDRVLIYPHKEEQLADIERFYPAEHYVLIDDKLRILDAVKRQWRERVTTIFPRQGHYAYDPAILAQYRPADLTIERIGDLCGLDAAQFRPASTKVAL